MEDNVKKVMQARSKAVANRKSTRVMEDVYRDEKGGIWYDKEEEMEYVHLLSLDDNVGDWEDEAEAGTTTTSPGLGNGIVVKPTSPYTNAYCPLDVVAIHRPPTTTTTTTSSSTASESSTVLSRPRPLLILPSRPRRSRSRRAMATHLANPASFIVDLNLDAIEAFLPRTPRSPKIPHCRSSSPTVVSFVVPASSVITTSGQSFGTRKQKRRPRPAPLKLTSAQSAHARANAKVVGITSMGATAATTTSTEAPPSRVALDLERARREFVEDSFRPLMVAGQGGADRKIARKDVRGVFGLNDT